MYQITTHDGKVYTIAQKDQARIQQLAKRLDLVPVTLATGKIEYFSKGTVARLSQTAHKPPRSVFALEDGRGSDRRAKASSAAYKAFQKKREELLRKSKKVNKTH